MQKEQFGKSNLVSCDELLNPEKTLEKPTNSEVAEEEAEKKHSRIIKIAVPAGIAVIVIGMVLLYMVVRGKADFEQVGARYINDPNWGAEETCPSYFDPVLQELTSGWMNYREGYPTSALMDAFCDRGVFNGGREENGLFISYIDYEKDTEPQYVFFHLEDLLTDADAGEWDWASAGAFCDEEQGKTYLCYYDFNDLTNAGERDPQLILVEFDMEDPENYQAIPYSVEPRDIFSWYCEGYRIGDDLYIAGQEELGAIDLNTKEFRYCREEKAWVEEYSQKVFGEENYYLRAFRGILEQEDVTVYSAEVAEAIDVPAVGMVFVAVRGNQPIAYMSVDLTAEDIVQGVETEKAE